MPAAKPELVGVAEIAEILGVTRSRAQQLSMREDFPEPRAVIRSGPIWELPEVKLWIRKWPRRNGRPPKS